MDYWDARVCIPHKILAHGSSKNETGERSRHKNNSKRAVRNLEKRNVGTKRRRPRQGLKSAEDIIIELSEGRKRIEVY